MSKAGSFPQELSSLRQWVCWRLEPDAKGGKMNKTPYDPATGRKASSTNPATWTALEAAVKAKDKYGYTGVGFVFAKGGGLVGIDIDHCLDPESGEPNAAAAAILGRVPPTYVEISPSGEGLHIFMRGSLPEGANKNSRTGVEMYAHSRYFTVTGKMYKDAPPTLAEDGGALAWIHDKYVKPARKTAKKKKSRKDRSPLTDDEVLEKAGATEEFAALWEGRWEESYQSQSEADMALCCRLAFWAGKNKEQMDRLFRQSGLLRAKWDEVHHAGGATYGEETLGRAMEAVAEDYLSTNASDIFEYDGRYFLDKGGKFVPLTNFLVRPLEMISSEEETQLTADLVTVNGEVFRQAFMTTDFANPQKFKNVLNKRTIALEAV
jgi:primase-polymerase (primpol)-like protein